MDNEENSLPDTISPSNFPAKLWEMANDPTNGAVSWSKSGEEIVIDQQLFESRILSPRHTFKTTNFTSIIRQLNLYGFKKNDMAALNANPINDSTSGHYHNPNFKRGHPELLVNLKRLTVQNKARQAGLEVNNVRFGRGGKRDVLKRKNSSTPSHLPSKSQTMDAQRGTPVPPRYLMRGEIGVSSGGFVPAQPMPVSLSPLYTMPSHQILPTQIKNGNPHFFRAPWHAHYPPGCSPPVPHRHHLNLVSPHGTGLQTQLMSPQSYNRAGYHVNILDSQCDKNQGVTNFETVFQRADEIMPTSPSAVAVKVEFPADVPRENVTANAPASNTLPLVIYKEQEEVITSVPEQMLEDNLVEGLKDAEVICVEVDNTSGDVSPE